jgi:hypothetical protein
VCIRRKLRMDTDEDAGLVAPYTAGQFIDPE